MRKIAVVLLFISVSAAYAQTQLTKGSKLLGGSLHFNSQNTRAGNFFGGLPQSSRLFAVSPQYGWFVRDNVAFGLSMGFNTSNQDRNFGQGTFDRARSTGLLARVFTRRYVSLGEKFALFGETDFSAGYNTGTRSQGSSTAETTTDVRGFSVGLGVSPGVTFFATKRLAVESSIQLASVSYTRSRETTAGNTLASDNFSLVANPLSSLTFGFIWFLSKPAE